MPLEKNRRHRNKVIALKKWLLSAVAFICAAGLTAVVGILLGLLLVGPHSDLLPEVLRAPTGLLIWAGVLGIPVWLSYKVFSKYASKEET